MGQTQACLMTAVLQLSDWRVGAHLFPRAWAGCEPQLSYMGSRPDLSHMLPLAFYWLDWYQITPHLHDVANTKQT